ncbi:MAG: hypothetical protein HY958_06765 [Bacteroidia bacterium]|nr:hypothetical protein [Bacteroidia bacterium]
MPDKFKNKYRSESTRLKDRDYSAPGKYFVTINTFEKQAFLGQIKDHKMVLSDIGQIAQSCYLEIPNHFNNVILDEYVIMPDHIHGIIEIIGFVDDVNAHNGDGFVDTSHGAYLQPTVQPPPPSIPQTRMETRHIGRNHQSI